VIDLNLNLCHFDRVFRENGRDPGGKFGLGKGKGMKVTIIGASISGLFSAYLLAREGVEVEVYERSDVLGWPPRTLIVTSKLNEVLDFVPEEAIINRVNYLELFSKSNSAKLELSEPDLVIEREKLIHLLASLAKEGGAKILLGHLFTGLARFGRKIVATIRQIETGEERSVSSDVLVGADGAFSAVCTPSLNGHRLASLLQAKVMLPEGMDSKTCQVWFDPVRTKYFYWLIPEGGQRASVGLIADGAEEAEACLETFLHERSLEPLEFQSAPVPIHRFEHPFSLQKSNQNVFIIGDAAAQVKGTTVGGLVTGLHGAKALANSLLNGGNLRKESRNLRLELNLHLLVRHILNRFNDENYDELIGMLNGGLKDILEEWTRDQLTQSFWKLILTEPRLVTLGAKTLLRSIFYWS
jgi:flavin-dependent dehydrogenase